MNERLFNIDFQDFIQALNEKGVQYLLIGGYSVILHGYSRTTGDMDIWVKPTPQNYRKLVLAFATFGLSVFDMTEEKFLASEHYDVFTFGRPPVCIDILTKVKGLEFDACLIHAQWFPVHETLSVLTIHREDLILAKKAAGRPKDWDDIENLRE
jgi:predicted nucleotidyltransferase